MVHKLRVRRLHIKTQTNKVNRINRMDNINRINKIDNRPSIRYKQPNTKYK